MKFIILSVLIFVAANAAPVEEPKIEETELSEVEQRFIAISTALAVALVGGASSLGTAASKRKL